MKLNKINTPFEKHRFITYNSKGDKAVCHNIEVQNVCGSIYKGKNEGGPYNEYCDIYVLYEGDSVGLKIHSVNTDYQVEEFAECVFQDKQAYISKLKSMIENNAYAQLLEIEFARHIAPELVEGLIGARNTRIKIREERSKKLQEEKEREAELRTQKDNEDAESEIKKLVEKIKNGGTFENTEITIHENGKDGVCHTTIVYLMEKNGINIPICTKGWIINNAKSFVFSGGQCVSIHYMVKGKSKSKGSTRALEYINELVKIIMEG